MTIALIFIMSLACVAAILLLLIRVIGFRKVLRYATVIDVIFTVVLCIALAGTLTGILIGIVAGLVMTGVLTASRAIMTRLDNLRANRATAVSEEIDLIWPGGTATSL